MLKFHNMKLNMTARPKLENPPVRYFRGKCSSCGRAVKLSNSGEEGFIFNNCWWGDYTECQTEKCGQIIRLKEVGGLRRFFLKNFGI